MIRCSKASQQEATNYPVHTKMHHSRMLTLKHSNRSIMFISQHRQLCKKWEHTCAIVHNFIKHCAFEEDETPFPSFNSCFCTPFPTPSFANFMDPREHSLFYRPFAYYRPPFKASAFLASIYKIQVCSY